MPNGQAQQEEEISSLGEKPWTIFWNFRNRVLGRYNIFRYGTIKDQTAPIWSLLKDETDINNNMLRLLGEIEESWFNMDKYLWDDNAIFLKLYEDIGHYDDPAVISLEIKNLLTGRGFRYDPTRGGFYLDPVVVNWSDGNREELYVFGIANIANILSQWEDRSSRVEERLVDAVADARTRPLLTTLRTKVSDLLKDINKTENEFEEELRNKLSAHGELNNQRGRFLALTQPYYKYIRFGHTYKVIKPFYWEEPPDDPSSGRPVYFDPAKNMALYGDMIVDHAPLRPHEIYRYKSFEPWPWEQDTGWEEEELEVGGHRARERFMTGLDENGYPLEIDKNGVVLTDKWRYEIGQNPWQRQIISHRGEFEYPLGSGIKYQGKGDKGGQLEDQKMQHIMTNGIRVVDKRFATDQAYLDPLEMAVYIYTEVDAIRDDTRDGRYHPHSKTAVDYIIHAERGIKFTLLKKILKKPIKSDVKLYPNKFTIVREILKEKMPDNLEYNQFDTNSEYGYIYARPDFFNRDVPKEESAVTRKYRIKEYKDDPPGPRLELSEEKEREPTNISPAFDRRALRRKELLVHWGRMFYYEDWRGINKWSENPYPHITTRGIAKYMVYWIAVRTKNLHEASEAAVKSERGYDIGIRRPLVGGTFVKDPFTDIISTSGDVTPI